jgi:hypothetical protein
MSDGSQSRTMECPDCGGTVSKRAANCPHCGAPIAAGEADVHSSGDDGSTTGSEEQTAVAPAAQPEAQSAPAPAVEETAASELEPLEMGNMTFAKEHLTEGETILHAGRFHKFHLWIAKIALVLILIYPCFALAILWHDINWRGKNPAPEAGDSVSASANATWDDYGRVTVVSSNDTTKTVTLQITTFTRTEDEKGFGIYTDYEETLEDVNWEDVVVEVYGMSLTVCFLIYIALLEGPVFVGWLVWRSYSHNKVYKTEFVLTNKRIITKWGFLRTVSREIQLEKIESVDYGQIILEGWFGIGRLTVRGTGGGKVGKFTYMLDALEFRNRILDQIDKASGS